MDNGNGQYPRQNGYIPSPPQTANNTQDQNAPYSGNGYRAPVAPQNVITYNGMQYVRRDPVYAPMRPKVKKPYGKVSFALLMFAVFSMLFAVTIGMIAAVVFEAKYSGADYPEWLTWLIILLPTDVFGALICWLFMRRAPSFPPPEEKLGGKRFMILILVCFPIMQAGSIIGTLLSEILSFGKTSNPLDTVTEGGSIFEAIALVVVAPLVEEFIFRKLVIDRTAKYGEMPAVLFSAVAFGLFHMNFYQMFYAFGLGLVFGYVYVKTGRLRYTIIMHAVINFMGGVIAPYVLSLVDLDALMDGHVARSSLPLLLVVLAYLALYYGLAVAGAVLFGKNVRKVRFEVWSDEPSKGRLARQLFLNVPFIIFAVFCLISTMASLYGIL